MYELVELKGERVPCLLGEGHPGLTANGSRREEDGR